MYPYTSPASLYHQPAVSSHHIPLRSTDISLTLRQQPKEALVTAEGKEKARKPVDPPPIIQLHVEQRADPPQHFLQSPYLFMCTSLWKVDKNEPWDGVGNKSLAGSLVSSLHRLKDIDNKDGGFFVFGDISVKVQGTFRLNFSLFDLHKDTNEVQYLGGITSEPFKVLLPKDFKGMEESTYLSRAFSDQGVRLRLRKEPRAMMGNKRPFPYGPDAPISNTPIRPNMQEYSSYGDESTSPNKRFRPDTEDRKEQYSDHTGATSSGFSSTYTTPQYPVRNSSLSSAFSMSQYPTFGGLTTGSTSPYQFRPSISNSSSFYNDSLLSTSSAGPVSAPMPPQQRYNELQPSYTGMFSNFAPHRSTPSSALAFSDDAAGLGSYRPTSGVALGGEDHRPATAAGISPPMSIPQAPQSQPSTHQSHDSLGSSRGASYSHSPEMVRTSGYSDRVQLGTQLHSANRSAARLDDHFQSNVPVYQGQRNALQVPPSEPNLTSHTDTGAIPPSLHYNPDLSQSTEAHSANSG